MATTDSRTGFRLPWSTDRSASSEATAEPADEPAVRTYEPTDDPGAMAAPEPSTTSQDAAGDAVRGQEDEPVTTLASDTAPYQAPPAPAVTTDESISPEAVEPASAEVEGQAGADPAAPASRPTKFLADLTRAMQAAAEQARSGTLEQFRADGTAVIEQIHARSATDADELRRQADDDVAMIKEWSKAEIARIREETEQRVGSRREQLEGQLERHAALIEQEIEKVRGRLATFEHEMEAFFDSLLREEDPAVFAARAASLPEPPSFEDPDHDALAALLREPGLGVPPVAEEPSVEVTPEASAEASAEAAAGEPVVADAPAADGAADTAAPEEAALDPEAAMAAIQAAAEAAAALEAAGNDASAVQADSSGEAEATAEMESSAEAETASAEAIDVAAEGTPEETPGAAEGSPEAPADATLVPAAPEAPDPEADPRLAMLGLTPDFAAAEMAAAEAAAADVEEVPEIGDEALAARLSGLVEAAPAEESAAAPTASTQVVVTGLVSVASIASFKRHLGRLSGVTHVGVSSGPDGEFLFAIEHDPATSLRDLIPTIPGFAPRVVGSGDGIVQVSAQDPQD